MECKYPNEPIGEHSLANTFMFCNGILLQFLLEVLRHGPDFCLMKLCTCCNKLVKSLKENLTLRFIYSNSLKL